MSGAPIRAAGASGRPQCRPSSTAPTWRATNRTRRERRDGSPPQSRSGGHPPRQIDRLSDQVATSTFQCRDLATTTTLILQFRGSSSAAPAPRPPRQLLAVAVASCPLLVVIYLPA